MGAWVLALTLFSAHGQDSCSTIENVAPGLGAVHDQADLQWCYAFAAADMITQQLQKSGALEAGERIHPLQLAALYDMSKGTTPNAAQEMTAGVGGVFEAVNAYLKKGGRLCKQSDLDPNTSSENSLFIESADPSTQYFKEVLNRPLPELRCSLSKSAIASLRATSGKIKRLTNDVWQSTFKSKCHVRSPELKWWTVQDPSAEERLKQSPPAAKDDFARVTREVIDRTLESGRLPAIRYNAGTVRADSEFALHWNTIVGRRRSPSGECQYIVRDSIGPHCEAYKDPSICRNGYMYLNVKELLPQLATVQGMGPPPFDAQTGVMRPIRAASAPKTSAPEH